MRTGIKLGPRAAAFVAVLLAASAVGILTPTLSNTVSKDVQVTGFAVTLTVDGIPDSVAPGGVFRVVATMANNANRPTPAVLRMEVRNPNNTVPDELTVYSQCGEEEVVSGTRLIYYIGWHGPLLAPKGVSFGAGLELAHLCLGTGAPQTRPPPRPEGRLVRSGLGSRDRFVGDRVRRILALRPARDPGTRSRGVRVPR